jgi:hypothetical protein|tara:strand:+ start:37 stop:435 length:399 start_codon:yes stop_codon:yes gene_type:complete
MKVNFEKQFGPGVDPWYAKAERWAKKQRFPINYLAQGLIAWLKKKWIDVKIENTMRDIDFQSEQIIQQWEENDRRNKTVVRRVEEGVFGDEGWSIQISNPIIDRGPEIPKSKLVTPSDASTMEKDEGDTTRP